MRFGGFDYYLNGQQCAKLDDVRSGRDCRTLHTHTHTRTHYTVAIYLSYSSRTNQTLTLSIGILYTELMTRYSQQAGWEGVG
jgi:hypothetical protein